MSYYRSQIAKLTKINIETIRYYENIGLLPAPTRDNNGYRLYHDDTIKKLCIIKYAKSCGFTLEEIKLVLTSVEDIEHINYTKIIDFINGKLDDIVQKQKDLNTMTSLLNQIKSNINIGIPCPIKSTFVSSDSVGFN